MSNGNDKPAHLADMISHMSVAMDAGGFEDGVAGLVVKYLTESEAKLIALMDGQKPPESDPGSIELGMVLYWLNTSSLLGPVWKALGKPKTNITSAMLKKWSEILNGPGQVAGDGTLVAYAVPGVSKYVQLDPGWAEAVFFYVYYLLNPDKVHGFVPAVTPQAYSGDSLTLALLGDWGTGTWRDGDDPDGPAQVILNQAMALNPGITVHLGDVYYTGTASPFNQETNNFVTPWQVGGIGVSYALNSNHEMYPGAHGYFDDALTSPKFAAQGGASTFAFSFGNWMVIGLDSAYDAHFPSATLKPFFLDGRITDADQLTFLKTLELTGKQVIVLTHHNPVSIDGTKIEGPPGACLWDDVTGALKANPTFSCANNNGAPQYWYWGHIHNGVVYSANSYCGRQGVNGRCSGHAAIPFGHPAYDIVGGGVTDYISSTPYSQYAPPVTQQENRALNGFTILTLTENGLTEDWYEQGNLTPKWTGIS